MKKELLIFILIMLLPSVYASMMINEVLANPSSDWNGNGINETHYDEWIEIYNNGAEINLINWKIGDKEKNYTFNKSICSDCFLIIYGNDTSLKLNNNDEEIFLYDNNGNLIEKFNYSISTKDVSWCKCSGSWQPCNATPLTENSCSIAQNQTQDNQTPIQNGSIIQENISESYIRIIFAQAKAHFGDLIEVEVDVYRGDTAKYALYTYVKDKYGRLASNKVSTHINSKFSNLSFQIPVKIDNNCDEDFNEDTYIIAVEGLDKEATKEIELEYNTECENSGNAEYSIDVPKLIQSNAEFNISVEITNNKDYEIEFAVWSYVYRSSACYSCNQTREENKKYAVVGHDETKTVLLKDILQEEIENGTYNIKIKIVKTNQKTPEEFTYSVEVDNTSVKKESILKPKSELNTTTIKGNATAKGITGKVTVRPKNRVNITTWLLAIVILLLGYIIYKKRQPVEKKENLEFEENKSFESEWENFDDEDV